MDFVFINVGFGNIVSANRIMAIIGPHSAPVKRIIRSAYEQGAVVDATYGRKTRSVIVADSGHIVLSSLQQDAINRRLEQEQAK